ncbi:hypothetical protein AF54_03048 [Serratia marcescens BIDMC 81]|nr:hypothetical protein AF54_03048 [Serratia marcescens BIDMC 81]
MCFFLLLNIVSVRCSKVYYIMVVKWCIQLL